MIEFTPSSWRKAGAAVSDAGTDFSSKMGSQLGSLSSTGADGGISMLDGLIAGVLPAVMDAVTATVDGLAGSMATEGEYLANIGDAYAEVEADAETLSGFMNEEY